MADQREGSVRVALGFNFPINSRRRPKLGREWFNGSSSSSFTLVKFGRVFCVLCESCVVTGRCSRPVLFDTVLLSHWPTNDNPPFASCFWPNFPINSRRRPELGHFRLSFRLERLFLLSSPSTKKDCGSVKASWAKRRCSSSRHALPEMGPNRQILQPPPWKRHRSPHLDTGPEDGFDSSTSPEGRW
jgi:hypothetical protein